jgi:two-component system, NarL family, response regulator LiaR
MIRVLIVDDHCVVREGLRLFLGRDPDLEIVDEAANGADAVAKARHLRPDVVLMDLLLPGISGLEAISIIRNEIPETKVVALSSGLGTVSVLKVIRAGANGYLLKDTQAPELRRAIKAVAHGGVHLSHQASASLMEEVRMPIASVSLTARETEVLHLLAEGHSNREIAAILHLSEDTVKSHVRHILEKFGVQGRTHAILAAMRLGLITSDSDASPIHSRLNREEQYRVVLR